MCNIYNPIFAQIATVLKEHGIESYFVGGCVRDNYYGRPYNDIDICLTNVKSKTLLVSLLSPFATSIAEEVGKKFSSWIVTIPEIGKVDFTLARRENKTGDKHVDFDIETENVTIQEDLMRRDITINAFAVHILTDALIEPYKGAVYDLENRITRPVSSAFKEDPLRVVRASRFISVLKLNESDDFLLQECKALSSQATTLSTERIGMELVKVMTDSKKPSTFFNFLLRVNWLQQILPELAALNSIPQNPKYHPEGSAYIHTLHCIDAATDFDTRMVMLCHDLGKAITTIRNSKGEWSSPKHELESVILTHQLLDRLQIGNKKWRNRIATLVKLHMPTIIVTEAIIRRTLRELHENDCSYDDLVEVCRCDYAGRPPLTNPAPNIYPDVAKRLIAENALEPIVTSQMLFDIGIQPSKEMGEILSKALELQDRCTLTKDNWLKTLKGCAFSSFSTIELPKPASFDAKKALKILSESNTDERIKEWSDKLKCKENIRDGQLVRFRDYIIAHGIDNVIERLMEKYESDVYKNKERSKGYEPRVPLYWLLYEYASKYGTPIPSSHPFYNMFTRDCYRVGSYLIQVMDGQGSVILIDHVKLFDTAASENEDHHFDPSI